MLTPSLVSNETPDISSKQNHVVLGDETSPPGCVVHEHVGDCRLTAGDEVGVGRYLLEEMGLASAAGAELDGVVVGDDERDHTGEENVLLAPGELCRLEADTAQEQLTPLIEREMVATSHERIERITG